MKSETARECAERIIRNAFQYYHATGKHAPYRGMGDSIAEALDEREREIERLKKLLAEASPTLTTKEKL
jgi:hypothetical protein